MQGYILRYRKHTVGTTDETIAALVVGVANDPLMGRTAPVVVALMVFSSGSGPQRERCHLRAFEVSNLLQLLMTYFRASELETLQKQF